MPLRKRRKTKAERLTIEEVRKAVFRRSHGVCEMRAHLIADLNKLVNSGKIDYSHAQDAMRKVLVGCKGKITLESMHWAHIKSRGAGGPDSVENTLASCDHCHALSHNAFGKPCPKKVTV